MLITLQRADEDPDSPDSQLIWQWRNDPVTREMSATTEVIAWERHRAWYTQAARDRNKVILIASESGTPAGMVRFDLLAEAEAEISINLNPARRDQGLGKPLLAAACAWGFDTLKLGRIVARIKPANLRSIKIFEGTGFVLTGEHAGYLGYHLTQGQLVRAPA